MFIIYDIIWCTYYIWCMMYDVWCMMYDRKLNDILTWSYMVCHICSSHYRSIYILVYINPTNLHTAIITLAIITLAIIILAIITLAIISLPLLLLRILYCIVLHLFKIYFNITTQLLYYIAMNAFFSHSAIFQNLQEIILNFWEKIVIIRKLVIFKIGKVR